MRESIWKTRYVTYLGNTWDYRNMVFDHVIEQLVDAGVTDLRYQKRPRMRLWVFKPRPRQVIFLQQGNFKEVQGRDRDSMISVNQIEKFLKQGEV